MIVAVLLVIAGCSSGKSHQSATTPDQVYLAAVHPLLPSVASATLFDLGHSICEDFAAGVPYVSVVSAVLSEKGLGLDADKSGRLIGAAMAAYCPDMHTAVPTPS